MKRFYFRLIMFWFLLLTIAIINAILRESFYKPLLLPYLGFWAHQISAIIGIIAFYFAIYLFLKHQRPLPSNKNLIAMGLIWIILTLIFETFMNIFLRHLTVQQVLATYYFWKGELWVFVLISLIISPLIISKKLRN